MKTELTKYLLELFNYSNKLDNKTLHHDDFIYFQRLGIQEAYKENKLTKKEYEALTVIYYELKNQIRDYLNLNRYRY